MSDELKIAIDFDGTIANTNSLKKNWIFENLGTEIESWLCDRSSCEKKIEKTDYDRMSKIIYSKENTALLETNPGVVNSIKELKKLNIAMSVLTARNKNNFEYAKEWLKKNNLWFYFDNVISQQNEGEKTKAEMAKELGCKVLIDDDERHLGDTSENDIIGILLKIGAEQNSINIENMESMYSWEETVSFIGNIQDNIRRIY